jgi:O-antigen/teichoic acid export membrane protein
MSFAGIVELAMSSADRLVLGITIGPAAVPFYTIPFSVVSRALLFPNSLMSAVLPQMIARQDRAELQSKALDVLLLLTPLFVAGILLSPQFMTLWMGAAFAAKATLPLQILGAAFWVEVVSSVLYFQILAEGKPKRNFYVGLASAPPYLMALVAFTTWWGVVGASLAYLVKASICLVGRMLATKSGLPLLRKSSVDALLVAAVLTIALFQDRLHDEHVLGALVLLLSLALKIGTHRSYLSTRRMRQRRA